MCTSETLAPAGDTFGDDLATFKNKPELINQWKRYYDELVLRNDFILLTSSEQIEFLGSFGVIRKDLFDRFKNETYLFKRYKDANASSKILAKNKPDLWIRLNRLYQRPDDLFERLSNKYLSDKFGQSGVRLENAVEIRAQYFIANNKRTLLGKDFVLTSGMIDKGNGNISDIFTNFSREELKNGTYSTYFDKMQPNLKNIVSDI